MTEKCLNKSLIYEILSVVEKFKRKGGYLWSDCEANGKDRNARLVGKVLGMSQYYGSIHATELSTMQDDWYGWAEQRFLLEQRDCHEER